MVDKMRKIWDNIFNSNTRQKYLHVRKLNNCVFQPMWFLLQLTVFTVGGVIGLVLWALGKIFKVGKCKVCGKELHYTGYPEDGYECLNCDNKLPDLDVVSIWGRNPSERRKK